MTAHFNYLGEKIKTLREEKGYSLDKLALLTKRSKSHIYHLENSLDPNPTINTLWKIAKALDVSIEFLIKEKLNPSREREAVKENFFLKFDMLGSRDKRRIEEIINLFRKIP